MRQRKDDIPALTESFIANHSRRTSKDVKKLSKEALEKLMSYDWPGNVRELENELERAVILCDSGTIGPSDLSIPVGADAHPAASPESRVSRMLEDVEKVHILRVLRETGGYKSRASEILGINRKTLRLKLRKFGL